MDDAGFREVFRGSPIRRAKLQGLRRNAAMAMGNSGEARFLSVLHKMEDEADPVVAEAASWAAAKIRSKAATDSV
jgi:epoxyqueuosine reductase